MERRWMEQGKCAAEINSTRNAKLIKKETSAQTKFIWVIRSDKERGRDSIALPKLLVERVSHITAYHGVGGTRARSGEEE